MTGLHPLFAISAAAMLLATAAFADAKSDFDSQALFRSSCAPCHGVGGDGDGPVAAALATKIKPLSTLAERHGGEFPAEYVYGVIDGRNEVKAHGTRVMPVWGTYFGLQHQMAGTDAAATEAATHQKIEALVEYIRSLQAQ
jgi:mono/diheme cytochrome c family protein